MTQVAILYPVFVQVALTFALQGWMRKERLGALRRGDPPVLPEGKTSTFYDDLVAIYDANHEHAKALAAEFGTEAVATIEPPPRRRIAGTAAFIP